jgi:hypothetical protein
MVNLVIVVCMHMRTATLIGRILYATAVVDVVAAAAAVAQNASAASIARIVYMHYT